MPAMETSTPVGSPMRRKLSMRRDLVNIERDEEDLESELRNRRLEAINKSHEQKRRSVAVPLPTALNAAQLAQHGKECLKLFAENKINSKNAFNLLLIDLMAAMAKKSDSEINKNFQIASCTLDASVKIYGSRVDAVHTEAMKMAGGFFSKELQEVLDIKEEAEENSDDETKENIKVKLKKRRRKATLAPASSLNTKSESETLLDAVPRKTLLSKSSDGSQLLTRVPKYNDSCLLMVDADVPCWPFDENESKVPRFAIGDSFDADIVMSLFKEIPINIGDKLCEAVSAIEFGRDAPDESDLEVSQTSTFEFDVNASIPELDVDEESTAPRLTVPTGGYDSGEEIVRHEAPKRTAPASLIDMKRRLSVHNMEYSMFDEKVLKSWAGPTYWKVKPTRMSHSENKENEDGSHAVGAKRTRKGKVKELASLFEIPKEVLDRHFVQSNKVILAKSTLCSWKIASVTLAEDYQYTPQSLLSLFHLPLNVVEPRRDISGMEDVLEDVTSGGEEDEVEGNKEELEYCSSHVFHDEPQGEDIAESSMHEEVAVWDAENMVTVPNKVTKVEVSALHRTKHVDMKHLKKCIWDVLTVERADSINFHQLLKICPTKLPRSIKSSMSAPMLFNAVLHLTNERSLVLRQPVKGADFQISCK